MILYPRIITLTLSTWGSGSLFESLANITIYILKQISRCWSTFLKTFAIVASYGLDPAYYYTLPGFTWDAMLKHTCINFELLTVTDMVMFVQLSIRGGLSQCSGRYARANNKYMESYDPSKSSSYLMYFDVNNLYGWAVCQSLPIFDGSTT